MIQKVQQQIVQAYSGLRFEEGVHLYYWNNRRVPKSVSGKVKEVVPPFDEAYWAKHCSRKEEGKYVGMSEHEIIHSWQTINEAACELGTKTHTFLEKFRGHQSASSPQEEAGIKFLQWLFTQKTSSGTRRYVILFRELRAYSRIYNFAGTMDLLVWDTELEQCVIFDYKTNKDLFGAFGWMLPPFEDFQSHNYNHYQVQLTYYRVLLEEIGVTIAATKIVYLTADGKFEIFDTQDLTADVKGYLDSRLKHVA